MNIRIQLIIVVGMFVVLTFLLNMIRQKKLELRYALSWIVVSISIMILACFPELLSWIAKTIGIANPVNMLFFFGFVFSLAIILTLTLSLSRMSIR